MFPTSHCSQAMAFGDITMSVAGPMSGTVALPAARSQYLERGRRQSFSAPIMAGIQALINQQAGGPQGNPNYVYYQLASQAYSSGAAGCKASSGNTTAPNCIFYNLTQGDIDVNCGGDVNCFGADATGGGRRGGFGLDGALSTSGQSYAPAFGAAAGWNFASGIGSVNVYNLVTNWIVASGN